MFHNVNQHFRKILRITNLILHMIVSLKNREMTVWICLYYRIPIFEMVFVTAEFKINMLLHFLCQLWERLVFQAVRQLAVQISIS